MPQAYKIILRICFFILVGINLIFASWYVLHNDILFTSDIARDFYLLQEVQQKKIVFLGPRSSAFGLYHGPLWTYVNFPGYLIGHGNPVVQGWYWIFLLILALIAFYFVAKKLFDELTASLFVLMTSLYSVYQINGLFNPHGAFFLLPIFFFTFVRYIQTQKLRFLVFSILLIGCIIQFQMAVGVPFFLLMFFYILWFTIKHKKKKHLLAFFLITIPLCTFIFFELRHNFLLTHFAIRQLQQSQPKKNIFDLIGNRIESMSHMEFLRYGPNGWDFYVFLFFIGYLIYQMICGKNKQIYRIFGYFFFGFFAVSLLNRYNMLYFYIFPLFPLVYLIFCSFASTKYKYPFLILFCIVYVINFAGIIFYLQISDQNIIGKRVESWKTMYTIAKTVYNQPDTNFGYIVYSPDVLGYQPRYAMEYVRSLYPNKNVAIFEKKPITYILIAPAAANNPYLSTQWWIENKAKVTSKPTNIIQTPTGYTIQKYQLSQDEINSPMDPEINPGLKYR